jgi:hypothetical protein
MALFDGQCSLGQMVVTSVVAVCAFIVGFLINLLAMSRMFVSNVVCENTRKSCVESHFILNSGLARDVDQQDERVDRIQTQITHLHIVLMAIATKLDVDVEALTRNFP